MVGEGGAFGLGLLGGQKSMVFRFLPYKQHVFRKIIDFGGPEPLHFLFHTFRNLCMGGSIFFWGYPRHWENLDAAESWPPPMKSPLQIGFGCCLQKGCAPFLV